MKKVSIIILLLSVILVSCGQNCNKNEQKQESNMIKQTDFNLLGKKVTILYPTMQAVVHYQSDKKLHWKTIDNAGNAAEGTEEVSYTQLGEDLFFVNWIEQDGTTVSQVVDMKNNKVKVFLTYSDTENGRGGRASDFFEGTLTINDTIK